MRIILKLTIALVLLSGTVAFAGLGGASRGGDAPQGAVAAGKGAFGLKPSGHVRGLYPGGVKKVAVRVRNNYPDPVRLGYLATEPRDAHPACTKENLSIEPKKRVDELIPPHRVRSVRVTVRMLSSATAACQGARFPLRFSAKAHRP